MQNIGTPFHKYKFSTKKNTFLGLIKNYVVMEM